MAVRELLMSSAVSSEQQIWILWVPVVALYGVGVGHWASGLSIGSAVRGRRRSARNRQRYEPDLHGDRRNNQHRCLDRLVVCCNDPVDGLRAAMILLILVSLISAPVAASLRNRGHA